MRRILIVFSLVVAGLMMSTATVSAQTPVQRAMEPVPAKPGCIHFDATGHNLCAGFRAYWERFGGLAIYGLPLTEEFQEDGLTVQYFERARFEWHPGAWPERYDVLLGLVGTTAADQRGLLETEPFQTAGMCPAGAPATSCVYFPQTRHTLSAGFLSYWRTFGGLAVFGYPISEEFREINPDTGQEHTVQYFERARFEWHPGVWPERFDVLLGRLGATLIQSYVYTLPGNQVFPEGVVFDEATDSFYVSSTTDGTIYRAHLSDREAGVFLPGGADGRMTATGMAIDDEGNLFISGGASGQMFVYDADSGELIASFDGGSDPTFVNDVAVTQPGVAYFTDSQTPVLYRVAKNQAGEFELEHWLDFTGTPLTYQEGFNVNGIAASADGQHLVLVQSNTGKLFRLEVATKTVAEIDLGGATLTAGDGIVLDGQTLYVVRNQFGEIAVVDLAADLLSGSVRLSFTDPTFAFPTTAALAHGRLLVVNSQFNQRGEGLTPDLPFTVSSVPLP